MVSPLAGGTFSPVAHHCSSKSEETRLFKKTMVLLHTHNYYFSRTRKVAKKLFKSALGNEIFCFYSQDAKLRSASRCSLMDVVWGTSCWLLNRKNWGFCLFRWLGGWIHFSQAIFLVFRVGSDAERGGWRELERAISLWGAYWKHGYTGVYRHDWNQSETTMAS